MGNVETIGMNGAGNGIRNGLNGSNGAAKSFSIQKFIFHYAFALQVIADILVITGSMMLGYYFYHLLLHEVGLGRGAQPFSMYFRLTLITVVILLLVFERQGLYRRTLSIMNIEEIKGIFNAVILTALIIFAASFYFKDISYSRLIITYSLIFLLIFLNIERYLFFKVFQALHTKGIGVRKVLIYGAGEAGQMLVERFIRSPRLGVLPIGFIDDNIELWGKNLRSKSDEVKFNLPVLGGFNHVLDAANEHAIDELVISMPSVPRAKIAEIIRHCEDIGLKFYFMPFLFDFKVQSIAIDSIDGVPLLTVKESKINWLYLLLKRVMDVTVAGLSIVMLAPIMAMIAILIRRDSPGPVLFKQERVGLNGKHFQIYKFRSMYIDAPKYAFTPMSSQDPRITKIGRLLRRTSLDELPQIFNVMKGEMSMVGPRPEMPFIVATYTSIMRNRLKVKPGITGLWQISADRAKQIHDNIDYDLYYIENFSPLLDVVIMIRTFFMAIKGVGAW
ncbi:MAG: sugar transferase [bacterium]|nr:sugar transferase [bacterium]